ncbi:O-antigen ligase family protein [Acinetobacter lwoffii]|uniref:O-antigen ligase family protein n=1 Tax=Acinetobacter lwoffii TaxID=28090 RepID=UPI003F8E5593
MIVNINKIFGLQIFILTSIIVILIISIPALAVLRVPLYVGHILFFFIMILYFKEKLSTSLAQNILIAILLYVIVQSMYLQLDWIVVLQSILMPLILIFTIQIASLSAKSFYLNNYHSKLAKQLLVLFPFFCISFNQWSETRQAGLFMNPNITAHMSVMLLPFALLGLRNKYLKLLAVTIIFLITIITASRSALMAFLLSCAGCYLISKLNKSNFLLLFILALSATLISMYAVDFATWFFSDVIPLIGTSDSRLLYMGYNGRDILMDQALDRFSSQPLFGLGFDGAKFEIDGHALSTHNGLLELLLRVGVIGSILFFAFILSIINLIAKSHKDVKPYAFMSLIAILSLSTNSSTFFVFNYLFIYTLIIVLIGYRSQKDF